MGAVFDAITATSFANADPRTALKRAVELQEPLATALATALDPLNEALKDVQRRLAALELQSS